MRAILEAADKICKLSGTSLNNVTRVHHFVNDLNVIYPALRVWQEQLGGAPVPFAAVRTPSPMPVPGCDVIVDIWAYQAG
jgi:enamine deaminase RidA (YjgF/YER057c/UK114 family)